MTLKRVPCPIPSLSLKNEWSGKVLAMSRLIIRSQAELLYTNNRYSTLYMYHDTTKKTPGKNSYNLIKLFICKTSTRSRLKCLKHQIWAWIKKINYKYLSVSICQVCWLKQYCDNKLTLYMYIKYYKILQPIWTESV